MPVCSRVAGARGEQEEWTEAPIQGDARTVCASPTDAAGPSDVGRRLDAPIFRKAREAITVGVEWPQLRARRLVPPRFPPGKPAGAENDRKRAPDVAYVCADGALISGKSYVFEPLESQLASVASG